MINSIYESLMMEQELDESGYMGIIEAGWIHSNGSVEELKNYQMGDHDRDAFRKVFPEKVIPAGLSSFPTAYGKYLKQGNIRYLQTDRGFNIELWIEPTESQMRAIRKGIKDGTGEFYFSVRIKGSYGGAGRVGKEGSSWEAFRGVFAK